MAQAVARLKASDLGFEGEDEEALDVLDLPQLYTKPSANTLLSTLADLSSQPPSWEATPRSGTPRSQSGTATPVRKKRKVKSEGVPSYLTKIISSPLAWIGDDGEREEIWEAASQRLSERSGRTAMGALTRTFAIPHKLVSDAITGLGHIATTDALESDDIDAYHQIVLHEPSLTADNLGFKTWASSYLLAKRLPTWMPRGDDLPVVPIQPGHKALELGAGTGLVGLAAAMIFQIHVILTDLPEIVPNLEMNVRANAASVNEDLPGDGSQRCETAVLDWSDPAALMLPGEQEQCPAHTFPLILVADPIYSSEHPRLLVRAIDQHLSREMDARVIVEMPIREAYGVERQDFRDRMTKLGLEILQDGEEVGCDDWSDGLSEDELAEVRCWWSVWAWP